MAAPRKQNFAQRVKTNYSFLRGTGLPPLKAALLAPHKIPRYFISLPRIQMEAKLAGEIVGDVDATISKYAEKGWAPSEYSRVPPTIKELYAYLLSKGVSPGEALYQTLVWQKGSKHYRENPSAAAAYALKKWVEWKAPRVTSALFNRTYNRASGSEAQAKKAFFEKDVAAAFNQAIQEGRHPALTLKVFGADTRKRLTEPLDRLKTKR